MNKNLLEIIGADENDRRDLFLATANRLGTPLQNVEKDFWVCWILDLLFNGKEPNEPRLLFKGGTSLSKAYGLISRFSEDVDVTVFREDIGHTIVNDDLEKLSGKQQRVHLDAIQDACKSYIKGSLKDRLNRQVKDFLAKGKAILKTEPVFVDFDDPDQQTLLIQYPSVIDDIKYYVKPTIKIEAGAKSALEPHRYVNIRPYIADDIAHNLTIQNIVTIHAERTFWDKIIILHSLRCWYDNRKQLRHNGHRISRHYYDIYKLVHSSVGEIAKKDQVLAVDCARHAQLFFNSKDLNLKTARPGTFKIMPTAEMIEILKRDYQAMLGMVFGQAPDFKDVMDEVSNLESEINSLK